MVKIKELPNFLFSRNNFLKFTQILIRNCPKRNLQTVIISHTLNQKASIWAFWKGICLCKILKYDQKVLRQKINGVTLSIFCPKIFLVIFFSKTFLKCPNTYILVQWVESYDCFNVPFWTIFDQNSGQLQKIITRKQKNWHLSNFNHEFLTYQSVFLQN
jgi:hypothetical protein